ncbi:hypothetical protein HYPSUDRAFT_208463 [Hypholoma sublateritium FD-334 SS-4]|uniref:Uncharacterized protein n=1 Tax=Hypholoma sublateritium (strain FD-334 SS-4) TaxID=945553 RepID=A0A0D2P2H6_HYPSF|nr:hypothetical protein HYPSUDRAFT_208463 [Hypholoma sublateritium FD-334 SS-4]
MHETSSYWCVASQTPGRNPVGTPLCLFNPREQRGTPSRQAAVSPTPTESPPPELAPPTTKMPASCHQTPVPNPPTPEQASPAKRTAPDDTDPEADLARVRRHSEKWRRGFIPPAGLQLVPSPPDGFPGVAGMTSEILRHHVDDESLALWDEILEDEYCIGRLAFDTFESNKTPKILNIHSFLQLLFTCPGLVVSVPGQKKLPRTDQKPIHPYLITGLSPRQIHILVHRGCWSTPDLTLFVEPSTTFLSRFTMTLRGPNPAGGEGAAKQIRDLVEHSLRKSTVVHTLIHKFHYEYYDDNSIEDVTNELMATIEAVPIVTWSEGIAVTCYNIYADPPAKTVDAFLEWLLELRTGVQYVSRIGKAHPQPVFNCNQCRGIDHPTGLCPYYALTGWYAEPEVARHTVVSTAGYGSQPSPRRGGGAGGSAGGSRVHTSGGRGRRGRSY